MQFHKTYFIDLKIKKKLTDGPSARLTDGQSNLLMIRSWIIKIMVHNDIPIISQAKSI